MSIPIEDGFVVGLFGRAGRYINAICIIVMPKNSHSLRVQEYKVVRSIMKSEEPRGPGPWGCPGGRAWDNGVYSSVRRVFLLIGYSSPAKDRKIQMLHGIQFEYVKKDGEVVLTLAYGGSPDFQNMFLLPYYGEHHASEIIDCSYDPLIGIEGFYGPLDVTLGCKGITSLTFYTKRNKFGPYGAEVGKIVHFRSL